MADTRVPAQMKCPTCPDGCGCGASEHFGEQVPGLPREGLAFLAIALMAAGIMVLRRRTVV